MKESMKRTLLLLTLTTGILLGACGGDSNFPTATGKASISAINAIYGSSTVNFSIEERAIGQINYKQATTSGSYDDLDYTFNFDIFFAGDTASTRIASQHIDFMADQHYTILASGTVAAPTLTVWEWPEREFTDTDTVFQARFAHTANSLSTIAVDVYFALEGVAPVAGAAVATLNYGEISGPLDFEADNYVVIITSSGNPGDIRFTSRPTSVLARDELVITPFDGDANDTQALVVGGLRAAGGTIPFPDEFAISTVQFLHASIDMGVSDVFDDVDLTSQVLTGHTYKDLTADAPIAAGDNQFFYTPTLDTTMVSLETGFSASLGLHFRVIAFGTGGTYFGTTTLVNRRSIDTAAKLLYFMPSDNVDFSDVYLLDADAVFADQTAFLNALQSRTVIPAFEVAPGSYDMYVTAFQEKEILAGPFRLDLAFGDVVDMVVYDTSDPVVMEIVTYPIP